MSQYPSAPSIEPETLEDTQSAGVPSEAAAAAPRKWANSFETPEALVEGVKNIRSKLNLAQIEYPSPEAAEGDYLALQKSMRTPSLPQEAAVPVEPTDGQTVSIPRPEPAAGLADILERVGLTTEDIVNQWSANGSLTEDQYSKIQSTMPGVSKPVINEYIDGQFARIQARQFAQDQILQRSIELAGGPNGTKQDLDNVLMWAKVLPENDQIDFNKRLKDPNTYERAVRELVREYRDAGGADPSRTPIIQGGQTPVMAGSLAITNRAEYNEAIKKAAKGDQAAKTALLGISQEMRQSFRS